jgi:hypothetical protein
MPESVFIAVGWIMLLLYAALMAVVAASRAPAPRPDETPSRWVGPTLGH